MLLGTVVGSASSASTLLVGWHEWYGDGGRCITGSDHPNSECITWQHFQFDLSHTEHKYFTQVLLLVKRRIWLKSITHSLFLLRKTLVCVFNVKRLFFQITQVLNCVIWIRQNKKCQTKVACEFSNFRAANLKGYTVMCLSAWNV